jgi:hypothetical protein
MYRAVLGQGEEVPVTFGGGGWWMEGKWGVDEGEVAAV